MVDRLTFRLSPELGRSVEEMLLETLELSNCEIVVLEAGSAVDIPLLSEMTGVIAERVIVEISRVSVKVVYQVWC